MRTRSSSMGVSLTWFVLGASALAALSAVLCGLLRPVGPDPLVLKFFDAPFLKEAAAYQRAGLSVYLIRETVLLVFLAAAALAAMRYFQAAPRINVLAAAGYILLLLVAVNLLSLPFSFYRGYVVEHSFGLSNHTAAGWFADYGKSLLISLVISTAALAGLYWLMLRWPARWWVIAGTAFSLFLLLSSYLYPLLIDPLFHRFTPLADEAFNERIIAMAAESGIAVDQVLVADASRRTRKVNAYFTGMGKTKRIVIYDTLLQRFDHEEVLAVIAHEMGHWRHGHINKGITMGALGGFAALFLFHLLLHGMGLRADFRAIPLALLFFTLISLGTAPLQNAISRGFERQADHEALVLAKNPAAFVSLKQNLARANLSTVRPHPLIKYTLYSHPPIIERIKAAEQYREQQ